MRGILARQGLGTLKHQNRRLSFLPTTPCKGFLVSAGKGDCGGRQAPGYPLEEGEGGLIIGQPFQNAI